MSETKHLVDVRNLKQYFTIKSGMLNKLQLKAVDGVSFTIDEGETLGLVGESGCGKRAKCILTASWSPRKISLVSARICRSSFRTRIPP